MTLDYVDGHFAGDTIMHGSKKLGSIESDVNHELKLVSVEVE